MANQKKDFSDSTEPEYWNDRYINSETGWDMHQVSPPLKSYVDTLKNKDLKILIPGCGNAYEAEYLLSKGFNHVTVIDFSSVVTQKLKEKYKEKPIQIVNENFFNHKGQYDLILEQTFFCALQPSLRENYVKHCYALLKDAGKIAGVFFNKKFVSVEPPFIANDDEYKKLFQPLFDFIKFEPCNNSVTPRLGYELYFEFKKKSRTSK